jgi:hypothetical protein
MGCSQVVRQRFLVACTAGSNPATPATKRSELYPWFSFFLYLSQKITNFAKLLQDCFLTTFLTTFKTVKGFEMPTETLTFSKERLAKPKDEYAIAKEAGLEEFNFDGYDFLIGYAYYLIEHLDNHFEKAMKTKKTFQQ